MTHAELVERAARWLRNTVRCRVVLTEHVANTPTGEIPDVIGWVAPHAWAQPRCVLVECKLSRSDFLVDGHKHFRRASELGLGDWRFYLTPPAVLKGPVPPGWGHYELRGDRVCWAAGRKFSQRPFNGPPFRSAHGSETALLVSALAKREKEEPPQ